MLLPCLPVTRRFLLSVALASLTVGKTRGAETHRSQVDWSLTTPPFEAGPRSFPTVAIHSHNHATSVTTLRLHFTLGPLRALGSKDLEIELQPNEEKTTLYTLYVPPETPGGARAAITARSEEGVLKWTTISIRAAAACKVNSDSPETRFARPGERVSFKLRLTNTGNVALHCTVDPKTYPAALSTRAEPATLLVLAGKSEEANIEVALGQMTAFTSLVTSTEVRAKELKGDDDAQRFLYFHIEAFPEVAGPDRTHLFETLKGSAMIGLGGGRGNDDSQGGGDPVVRQSITLSGMITDKTRMEFIESFTHPSGEDGNQSSALSSLPSGSSRNFFHLGLYNPYFDLEAGEVTAAPPILLSSRETGDGGRVTLRPFGTPKLQLEVFAEENTLTLNRKTVFGSSISGSVTNSPLEWWRAGTLSKRDDVGPQGSNWDAVGLDSGWRIPLALPLRAQVSVAAGSNSEGRSGFAWLLGFHFNRTLPGEPDNYPLKAGVEFASGNRDFPGAQNGREDHRAYVSYRPFTNPVLVELFANYNNSQYKVVPNIEKTLDEEQSLLPDFLLNSQSRLINAGVRWNTTQTRPGDWHFPNGNIQFEDTSYFNKSDFLDKTTEHAVALNLELFNRQSPLPSGTNWQLSSYTRGGTENHMADQMPGRESSFITLGADLNYSRQAPVLLQEIGRPGTLAAQLSTRYTVNLSDDPQAVNRTGISLTAAAALQTEIWEIKAGVTLYCYVDQGLSDRIWTSVNRRIGKDWWAGIEAAYTHRATGHGSGEPANEGAILFTVRHDFELPVPWLARHGQATGVVFADRNNNGRQDPSEPGLDGVKVAVGSEQALTGRDGKFTLSAMTEGSYPVIVTPPAEIHLAPSSESPVTTATLQKGSVTNLALGLVQPTTCEGKVTFVREAGLAAEISPNEQRESLDGLELICTDASGRLTRSGTRADGFFALYLEPGTYEVKLDPAGLRPQETVTPEKLTLKVKHDRIQNLSFVLREHAKRIRKTFTAEATP